MSPADRAKACYAAAEAAEHPADKAALRGAARLWERVAGPGVPWSWEPVRRQLADLKRDLALATGPFTPPEPPKAAPAPACCPSDAAEEEAEAGYYNRRAPQEATIAF